MYVYTRECRHSTTGKREFRFPRTSMIETLYVVVGGEGRGTKAKKVAVVAATIGRRSSNNRSKEKRGMD